MLAPLRKVTADTPPAQQQSRIEMVQRHAQRMLRLVNQLMDFRRLEEGALRVYPRYMDLAATARKMLGEFEPHLASQQLRLETILPQEPVHIFADPEKLELIFFNLLSNSLKYTPAGGWIRVEVAQGVGDQVQLVVCNAGPPLSEKDLAQLFKPFFRGGQASLTPGSGIGLAFTRALVEMHQGRIEARSGPDTGLCIVITLPAGQAPVAEEAPATAVAPPPAPETGLPCLLVADDSADIRALIRQELGRRFDVVEARSGAEALTLAQQCDPDIVLLDVMMPPPDGIAVCRTLKAGADTRHIPVVLLTGLTGTEPHLQGLEAGADDVVTKPFSPVVLLALLENLLRNRALIRRQVVKDLILEPDPDEPPGDQQLLRQLVSIVERRMADPAFGPEALVAELPFGKSYVYKHIKELTGQTPGIFIRSLRLKRAATLLRKSPLLNVSQVAYQVGFEDPAYFSRCFKEQFSVTPRALHKGEKMLPD
ncbi:MAG: hypothetical protein OHK0039_34770 [Bacteroidia bacterium]